MVLVGAGVFVWRVTTSIRLAGRRPCQATVLPATYRLDAEQGANAATIAAVGKRLGLPDHAVTVALAAALQESRLHNLSYGDRDSAGLFQQRPSQGWGTRAQILQPPYAASAFFRRLAQLPDWQNASVTEGAQAVQRSAAPNAYAQWEAEARVLAITLTGERPAGFTCRPRMPSGPTLSGPLAAAMQAELGAPGLEVEVASSRGWTIAGWLVAHAQTYRIPWVSFEGRRWTATTGSWEPSPTSGSRVQIGVA